MQKHIIKEHPNESKDVVFACGKCKFITVNKRKYELHVLNHDYGNNRGTSSAAKKGECQTDVNVINDNSAVLKINTENNEVTITGI